MSGDIVITKEMGVNHQDFFRYIGRALRSDDYQKKDDGIVYEDGPKRLKIDISEERERRIALIVLPVTNVTLTFKGYAEHEVKEAIRVFDLAFQRGGG